MQLQALMHILQTQPVLAGNNRRIRVAPQHRLQPLQHLRINACAVIADLDQQQAVILYPNSNLDMYTAACRGCVMDGILDDRLHAHFGN